MDIINNNDPLLLMSCLKSDKQIKKNERIRTNDKIKDPSVLFHWIRIIAAPSICSIGECHSPSVSN